MNLIIRAINYMVPHEESSKLMKWSIAATLLLWYLEGRI